MAAPTIDIDTRHDPARPHLSEVRGATGALIFGHGAGGGVGAHDLNGPHDRLARS